MYLQTIIIIIRKFIDNTSRFRNFNTTCFLVTFFDMLDGRPRQLNKLFLISYNYDYGDFYHIFSLWNSLSNLFHIPVHLIMLWL
jgi:hypothetical protein